MTKPKQFRPPLRGSGTYAVVMTILNHGPKTVDDGIKIHGKFNLYLTRIKAIYKSAANAGWIVENDGVYSLTPHTAEYYSDKPVEPMQAKPEVVAPPYHPPFKPLKMIAKPMIREDAPPLRDMCPKTGTAGFYELHRD